ncbi:MAG TPA: hypothetical protein VE596_04615 [Gaiellaceae bacterium]|nr:hypothetical protein [Gaiellaceae bacterium]
MSLRSADVRFLLPRPPRTAFVEPGLESWRDGLEQAGVELVEDRADLAVVRASHPLPEAEAYVVVGRGGRRALRGWGPVRRYAALPEPREPQVIVPVDRPAVASYMIRNWTVPDSVLRRRRNDLARLAISLGVFPELGRSLAVATPEGPPFVVAAGAELGVPADASWFLTLGEGDALTRAVFQLFGPGEREPEWVLKLSRVRAYTAPFERDERGLRLAAASGDVVVKHAPRLLGRFEADGLPCSLESAAAGLRLTYLLQRRGSRRDKLRAIDAVAGWALDAAKATAAPAGALDDERRRLEQDVLPRYLQVPPDLVSRLPPLPAVLQHNDLGCWNVVVGRGFTVVDWESARRHGFALWDLLYFLVDALVHLDGAWQPDRREPHAARLLLGETPSSEILFRWVREAVRSLDLPADAVGPVVTLGWLHHGLSPVARDEASRTLAPGLRSHGTFAEWMAKVWLGTEGLGPEWSSWRG